MVVRLGRMIGPIPQLTDQQVESRSNVRNECSSVVKDSILWSQSGTNVSKEELIRLQINDASLRGLFVMARKANDLQSVEAFSFSEDVLIRKLKEIQSDKLIFQVVVPTFLREVNFCSTRWQRVTAPKDQEDGRLTAETVVLAEHFRDL